MLELPSYQKCNFKVRNIMRSKVEKIYRIAKNLWAALFGLLSIGLAFVSWDDIAFTNICVRLWILLGIVAVILILSTLWVLLSDTECVWKRGASKINVQYGDILRMAQKKPWYRRKQQPRIIVIPVNTHFDTIVDNQTVPNPLVSRKTIHGKWLLQYANEMHKTPEQIEQEIFAFLDAKHVEFDNVDRPRGSHRKYPAGTCAMLLGNNNASFLLLALSEFDEHNTAHATKESLISVLHSLIDFINQQSQGVDCFIPLLGTGLSRTGFTHKESLHTILSTLDLYNEQIIGKITVVVYSGDKSNVSIYDR